MVFDCNDAKMQSIAFPDPSMIKSREMQEDESTCPADFLARPRTTPLGEMAPATERPSRVAGIMVESDELPLMRPPTCSTQSKTAGFKMNSARACAACCLTRPAAESLPTLIDLKRRNSGPYSSPASLNLL